MKPKIPYASPSITDLEVRYATDAAANGWGDECYGYIDRFEELFKKHLGVEKAIATSSCTGALHMGMSALGIGPGDEVILADTNWIATASPIVHLGAKPIFVDILEDSWCIDPAKAEAAITPHTKAIIAVHLYGNLCDMDRLLAIGEKYDIAVIEDAAEVIGQTYNGQPCGSFGDISTLSFYPNKHITTGEGGMVLVDDDELAERCKSLRNLCFGKTDRFVHHELGWNFRMSNLQAAVGVAQLERLSQNLEKKREIGRIYHQHLEGIETLTLPLARTD